MFNFCCSWCSKPHTFHFHETHRVQDLQAQSVANKHCHQFLCQHCLLPPLLDDQLTFSTTASLRQSTSTDFNPFLLIPLLPNSPLSSATFIARIASSVSSSTSGSMAASRTTSEFSVWQQATKLVRVSSVLPHPYKQMLLHQLHPEQKDPPESHYHILHP